MLIIYLYKYIYSNSPTTAGEQVVCVYRTFCKVVIKTNEK